MSRTLCWLAVLGAVAFCLRDGDLRAVAGLLHERDRPPAGLGEAVASAPLPLPVAAEVDPLPEEGPPPRPISSPVSLVQVTEQKPRRRPTTPIEDPCVRPGPMGCLGHALDPLYRALAEVRGGESGTVTRIAHFGDSLIADDQLPTRARQRLQRLFGDGGAGFNFISPPSRWNRREGVELAARGWSVRSITGTAAPDGIYGIGGASFESSAKGAVASFATVGEDAAHPAPGGRVSRFEIAYLLQAGGGALDLLLDGVPAGTLETAAEAPRSAFYRLDVPDGPHTLLMQARGRVRAFGVIMERTGPGVVYDNLGLLSGSARALTAMRAEHLREQLVHRHLDLLIMQYGTNEADSAVMATAGGAAAFRITYEKVLGEVRAALPATACLVIAPPDAAAAADGELQTKAPLPRLVEAARRAAQARGCGFWDSYAFMGGSGAAVRWHARGLLEGDFTHLTRAGAFKVADGLVDAILFGLEGYLRSQARSS